MMLGLHARRRARRRLDAASFYGRRDMNDSSSARLLRDAADNIYASYDADTRYRDADDFNDISSFSDRRHWPRPQSARDCRHSRAKHAGSRRSIIARLCSRHDAIRADV